MSSKLRREIKSFAFAYRSHPPRFLVRTVTTDRSAHAFESELQSFASLPPELAAWELIRTLGPGQTANDPATLRRPTVLRALQRNARGLGPDSAEVVELMLATPELAIERFRSFLADYWEAGFNAEWERLAPSLDEDVFRIRRAITSRGLYGMLKDLHAELRVDAASKAFWIDDPHEHDVDIGVGGSLLLVLSTYGWPHVHASCDDPWPLGVVLPSPSAIKDAQIHSPPVEALRAMRALADDTRLRALRYIAERPRSTQELAPLVRLSEAAISNHLRTLAAAGLINSRREGYYVLYDLDEDRLAAIHELLTAYLSRDLEEEG